MSLSSTVMDEPLGPKIGRLTGWSTPVVAVVVIVVSIPWQEVAISVLVRR